MLQKISIALKKTIYIISLLSLLPVAYGNQFYDVPSNKKSQLPLKNAKVTIINVWATWCVPCRTEMPVLSKWYQAEKKKRPYLGMVGIALDKREPIQQFLKTTPVSYPIWRFEGDSNAWMKSIGNNIGAVPYTVVQAQGCQTTVPILGLVDGKKLNQAVNKVVTACRIK